MLEQGMDVHLKRTGPGAGKSGHTACAEARDGRIEFSRGFAHTQIPDAKAKEFTKKLKAGEYFFVLAIPGEGDPYKGLVVDTLKAGDKSKTITPKPDPLMPYTDATKLGLGPKALATLRRQTQDVDGKTKTFLFRKDVDELLAAKKAKEK
jgi:hypothetical protein